MSSLTFTNPVQRLVPRRPGIWPLVRQAWGRVRPGFLVALPIVFGIAAVCLTVEALRIEGMNKTIRTLRSGRDIAVATTRRSELLLARIQFLLAHDRVEEAQPYVEAIDKHASDKLKAIAHYNFANGRLRQGFNEITSERIDKAGPYIVLSREEYRRALTFEPDDWDAKFNLDVASRLVRDFPAFERTTGDDVKTKKKLWTDVPGKPEGLP